VSERFIVKLIWRVASLGIYSTVMLSVKTVRIYLSG